MRRLFLARWIIPNAFECFEGGGVLVEDGLIRRVVERGGALPGGADIEVIDLGDRVITPGLINAHAHLELSDLAGLVPPGENFLEWIGVVLRQRAERSAADFDMAVEAGALRMLATGTTCVGDVDSTGAAERCLGSSHLGSRVYREFLDAHHAERAVAEIERLEAWAESPKPVCSGLSPHGPHTVSGELLRACAEVAGKRELPVSLHWAETSEEREWMLEGAGPFSSALGKSPSCSGLEHLDRCGLLCGRVSLVHGNFPEPGDLEAVARAGAILVHCPGTHRFFDREPVDMDAWVASGATIALGTDSLASNDDLDLRLEMARVREDHPQLAPELVFDWATRGGARALGLESQIGELGVGMNADLVAFEGAEVQGREAWLERLTSGRPEIEGVWIRGERV